MLLPNFKDNLLKIQQQLYHFALSLTLDREKAKNLLQDTNLKTLENYEKFTQDTNFKGWVCTIMRNIFINDTHTIRRNQDTFCDLEGMNIEDKSQEGALSFDEKELILRYISSLDDKSRVMWKMYIRGYQYDEIAKQPRVPLGTVKSRLFYIKKNLRQQLAYD